MAIILFVNSFLISLRAYTHKMILSTREYARKYAGNCSRDTVLRKIQRGLLPTNHIAKKVGRDYLQFQQVIFQVVFQGIMQQDGRQTGE